MARVRDAGPPPGPRAGTLSCRGDRGRALSSPAHRKRNAPPQRRSDRRSGVRPARRPYRLRRGPRPRGIGKLVTERTLPYRVRNSEISNHAVDRARYARTVAPRRGSIPDSAVPHPGPDPRGGRRHRPAPHDNIFNGFPLTRCTRIPLAVIRSYFWMVALPLLGYTVAAGGGSPHHTVVHARRFPCAPTESGHTVARGEP